MNTTPRAMTKAHFLRRVLTTGFKPEPYGYWRLPPPCDNTSVYAHGHSLRSKLADLFNSMDHYQAEKEKEEATKSLNRQTPSAQLELPL